MRHRGERRESTLGNPGDHECAAVRCSTRGISLRFTGKMMAGEALRMVLPGPWTALPPSLPLASDARARQGGHSTEQGPRRGPEQSKASMSSAPRGSNAQRDL